MLEPSKCKYRKLNFLVRETLKLTLLKIKEPVMIFSKLMIVEIDMKNALYHIIQQMKKKEFQKEFHLEKFRIKEIDLNTKLPIALCVRKKESAMNSIGQFKIKVSFNKITSKLILRKKGKRF